MLVLWSLVMMETSDMLIAHIRNIIAFGSCRMFSRSKKEDKNFKTNLKQQNFSQKIQVIAHITLYSHSY
jgi:hypothetical protein